MAVQEVQCQRCHNQMTEWLHKNKSACRLSEKVTPIYYCMPCNRFSTRLAEVLKNNQGLRTQYFSFTAEDKVEFFANNNRALDADIPQIIKSMITKTTVSTKASDFVAESVWLDEDDLKHKYKNKPEHLKAVLTTAQSFVHPVRGVKLYEDFEYKSAEMNRSRTKDPSKHPLPQKKP